ncbi:c-type cytochrome [Oscillochloris sp. ZM17-4]|uniref:c-type cytochrome n=1 Tax=Oscillochloris sp. ZM17-4 TaxID=2866714 RepID=UPI001C733BEC|nr:c-type cytochrome [Oscillochloris sp. ZM17-4]MBX0326290.1 c-type cytochrome [Oscillochloris sp. ZM17-4]
MDYLGLSILIILALIFGFLTYRAARARRLWVRLVGGIPAGLLTLLFSAATILAFVGYSKINAVRPNPPSQLRLPDQITPQLIADGERFARSCAGCHSSGGQPALDGHDFLAEDGALPMGTLWAPNLTPAHLGEWTDGEIIRAIREGVGRDGRSLVIMPSAGFRNLSDEDVLALVAYLRAQPAVEPASPPRQLNVLTAILFATILPPELFSAQEPITAPVSAPPRGPTAAYGGYLVSLGCADCHGSNLAGVPPGGDGPPPGPNLTTMPQRLSADELVTLLRTGVYPDGHALGEDMPWRDFEKLSDDDLRAIYAYLASLEPLPDNQ